MKSILSVSPNGERRLAGMPNNVLDDLPDNGCTDRPVEGLDSGDDPDTRYQAPQS